MKATTKIEKEVERLSETLPPITDKHVRQGLDKCFAHEAWYSGRDFGCFCTNCGAEFDIECECEKTVCPNCGKTLAVKKTRRLKLDEKRMFAIVTTCKDYQVTRYVEIKKHIRRFCQNQFNEHCEVARCWLRKDGKMVYQARPMCYQPGNCDRSFLYHKPLSIRNPKSGYNFDMIVSGIYSPQRVAPFVRRNGYNCEPIVNDSPSFVFHQLMVNPKYETLWKAGYQKVLFATNDLNELRLNWPSFKIAMRNHYKPKDVVLWYDMLQMMRELGKDLLNKRFVCPKNLKAMHDSFMRQLAKKRKKEEDERRKEELRKDTAELMKKKAYFGIAFGNDMIQVSVLATIKDYEEEGNAMHHCVFERKYFSKPDSICLSAKDCKGNRLATIELSLTDLKILQCRASCNQVPKLDKEIRSLVNENIGLFVKAGKEKAA